MTPPIERLLFMHRIKPRILITALCSALLALPTLAQEAVPEPPPESLVTVNWFEEMQEGGMTMIALAALSIAMVVFILERTLRLRSARIAPRALAQQVVKLVQARRFDDALKACKKDASVLGEVGAYLLTHRQVDPQLTMAGAGDLAARAIDAESERAYPLAVIAALAPLLGLLGTMIGMIEAFKLVEVFGDEGGASLLAGSISKALITTAVGLILAIPALVAYHIFRHRVNLMANRLEVAADAIFQACYFQPQATKPAANTHSDPNATKLRLRPDAATSKPTPAAAEPHAPKTPKK